MNTLTKLSLSLHAACLALCVTAAGTSQAANIPVLTPEVAAGGGTAVALKHAQDPPRKVDGSASDWTGALPGFGGALDYSHGELVYEDHIFDAYGADNGQDAQRMATPQVRPLLAS